MATALAKAGSSDALLARHGCRPRGYLLLTLHRPENVDDPRVLRPWSMPEPLLPIAIAVASTSSAVSGCS